MKKPRTIILIDGPWLTIDGNLVEIRGQTEKGGQYVIRLQGIERHGWVCAINKIGTRLSELVKEELDSLDRARSALAAAWNKTNAILERKTP